MMFSFIGNIPILHPEPSRSEVYHWALACNGYYNEVDFYDDFALMGKVREKNKKAIEFLGESIETALHHARMITLRQYRFADIHAHAIQNHFIYIPHWLFAGCGEGNPNNGYNWEDISTNEISSPIFWSREFSIVLMVEFDDLEHRSSKQNKKYALYRSKSTGENEVSLGQYITAFEHEDDVINFLNSGYSRKLTSLEPMMTVTETLPYSRYIIREERPSLIDPEYTVSAEVGMRCPKCSERLKPLNHGQSMVCRCSLRMTLHGNALECTIDQPQGKAKAS